MLIAACWDKETNDPITFVFVVDTDLEKMQRGLTLTGDGEKFGFPGELILAYAPTIAEAEAMLAPSMDTGTQRLPDPPNSSRN